MRLFVIILSACAEFTRPCFFIFFPSTVICLTMFNETEKFVEANTQELAKDKWLCPLSGKKFRGPDFVRKHIFNKHMDKVEAVRMEVCVV